MRILVAVDGKKKSLTRLFDKNVGRPGYILIKKISHENIANPKHGVPKGIVAIAPENLKFSSGLPISQGQKI